MGAVSRWARGSIGLALLWRVAAATAVVVTATQVLFAVMQLAQGERTELVCAAEPGSSVTTCTLRRGGAFGGLDAVGTFPLAAVDRTDRDCERGDPDRPSRCAEGLWVARWTGPEVARADDTEEIGLVWVPFTDLRRDFPDDWRLGDAVERAKEAGTTVDVRVSTADPSWFTFPLQAVVVAVGIAVLSGAGLLVRRYRQRARRRWATAPGDDGGPGDGAFAAGS